MKLSALSIGLSALAVASLAIVFSACGGGSSNASSNSSGGSANNAGTGSDQQYVATLCKAMVKFEDSLNKLTADPSKLQNSSDISKAFTAPLDQLVSDMKAAKPPKDVKSYHDQVVNEFIKAEDTLKKGGDLNSLSSLGNLPQPPQAVSDRLQKVADSNSDCQQVGFSFGQQ